MPKEPTTPLPPFEVHPKACGFRDHVDVEHLNRLIDEMEVEDFLREMEEARRRLAAGRRGSS